MNVRALGESQLQRLLSSTRHGVHRLRAKARPKVARVSDRLAESLTRQVAALTSSLADSEVLRWSGGLTHSAATVYDRALDVEQVRSHLRIVRRGVPELLSAGLGAVGLVFVLQRGDLEQLSELLGSMGITAVLSANPLLGLCVVATTGYSYWQARQRGEVLTVDGLSAARGAALAGSSAAVFSVLAGPAVLKMVVAIAVTGAVRKLTTASPRRAPAALDPLSTPAVRAWFSNDRDLVEAMRL
jgi:hypothetical protein